MRIPGPTLRQIRVLHDEGRVGSRTDGQLLDWFASRDRESAELAFEALVERHGPMVLGVCRAVLGDDAAARDAFQATFLVLLRKSHSLRVRESLGPWLYRVAHRAARNARAAAGRRGFHERRAAERRAGLVAPDDRLDDLAGALHEELMRLPARYRDPMVLCDLEGHTHEEAARRLGCPVGTVKSRLARGRGRMRERLTRRGLAPSAGVFAALPAKLARATVPGPLAEGTVAIMGNVLANRAVIGGSSTSAVALARMISRPMSRAGWLVATVALAGASLAIGARTLSPLVEPASPRQGAPAGREIGIRVVDAGGKPIRDAHVFKNHVYKLDEGGRPLIEDRDYRTDAEGRAQVDLAGISVDLRLWARREGFVPSHAMWAKQFQSDGDRIPAEFTFQLGRGTEIGGVVDDERGTPIAGVFVEARDATAIRFHLVRPGEPGRRPVRPYSLAEGASAATTDERGRWKLGGIPPDEDLVFDPDDPRLEAASSPIELRLGHPGTASDRPDWGILQRGQGVTLEALRAGTARIVLPATSDGPSQKGPGERSPRPSR